MNFLHLVDATVYSQVVFLSYYKVKLVILKLLQVLVHGQPGEEVKLELILRVVADVGLVVSVASMHNALFN